MVRYFCQHSRALYSILRKKVTGYAHETIAAAKRLLSRGFKHPEQEISMGTIRQFLPVSVRLINGSKNYRGTALNNLQVIAANAKVNLSRLIGKIADICLRKRFKSSVVDYYKVISTGGVLDEGDFLHSIHTPISTSRSRKVVR